MRDRRQKVRRGIRKKGEVEERGRKQKKSRRGGRIRAKDAGSKGRPKRVRRCIRK